MIVRHLDEMHLPQDLQQRVLDLAQQMWQAVMADDGSPAQAEEQVVVELVHAGHVDVLEEARGEETVAAAEVDDTALRRLADLLVVDDLLHRDDHDPGAAADEDVGGAFLDIALVGLDVSPLVGPMGVRGRASFPGAWLDLSDEIAKTSYDLSDFNAALVDFYKLGPQGQVGLPFAVYPSALWYNKDLFDEAGLPYPPQEYGAPYIDVDGNEKEWTLETMRELRTRDPECRVIVSSGYSDDPVMAHYRDYGFRGALVKPYSIRR